MSHNEHSSVSNEEWRRAENIRNEIYESCKTYFIEKVNPILYDTVPVTINLPMTENLNMPIAFNVPKSMMDEDNTALMEFFVENVYHPDPESYMATAVNKIISLKQRDLLKFEENLANFNAAEFMSE